MKRGAARPLAATKREGEVPAGPEGVREALQDIAETFQTRDLSIVTIAFAFEDRVRSYQLVAEACGLAPRP